MVLCHGSEPEVLSPMPEYSGFAEPRSATSAVPFHLVPIETAGPNHPNTVSESAGSVVGQSKSAPPVRINPEYGNGKRDGGTGLS